MIKTTQQDAEVVHTRRTSNTLKDFYEGVKISRNAIILIHPSERTDTPNDEYFVGCIMDGEKKLDNPGKYSSTLFNKIIGSLRCGDIRFSVWKRMWINCTAREQSSIFIEIRLIKISGGPLN